MTQPDTPTPDAPAPDAPGPETAAPVAAGEPPAASTPGPRSAGIRYVSERTGAFVDAVVAIAMTLLILPLMETSSELAHGEMTAGQWLEQHAQQLISFLMSFVLIARFWMGEHQMSRRVERVDGALMWLTMGWLLSIVWLPVATALAGQASAEDPVAKGIYIGGMAMVALIGALQRAWLLRHPELGAGYEIEARHGLAAYAAMTVLFTIALLIALVWPPSSYYPMLAMVFVRPLQVAIGRLQRGRGRPA